MTESFQPDNVQPISNQSPPPLPPPQSIPYAQQFAKPKRSVAGRIFLCLCIIALVGSVLLNIVMASMLASAGDYSFTTGTIRAGEKSQTIAVYNVTGPIFQKAVKEFSGFYNQIKNNENVKAVVLRIDSPGGGMASSDQIHNMVEELAENKTVVISMGATAASGAYYISAPAAEIVAEETTITGSIGVIAAWIVLKGTLEKIGAEPVVIKSTHADMWKDEMSTFRKPSKEQFDHIRSVLDSMQKRFESVVKKGRGNRLNISVKPRTTTAPSGKYPQSEIIPFNGKIYLAREAMKVGLVDTIGYQEDAIDRAGELANLDDPKVIHFSPKMPLIDRIFASESKSLMSLNINTLHDLQTPRILLMWKAQ